MIDNRNILITGVAGFIGSHLAEYFLHEKYNVIGIDNFDDFYDKSVKEANLLKALGNPNFSFKKIDITNKSELKTITEQIDTVIHIAAKAGVRPSINNPNEYIQTNIVGTENILEWMKERDVKKLVFASSSSVYGNNTKVPFNENDNVDYPISPYAFTKKACELINYTYHHLYNFNIINLRFFTVYGERQRPDLAIHKFTNLILNNEPIIMYGDGETARDYTYIKDTISGIAGAHNYLQKNDQVFETVNLGNSNPIKLKILIHTLYQLLGKEPNIIRKPMQEGDVECTYADIKKAQELFDYTPKTSLNEGLQNFISWIKSNRITISQLK